MRKDVNRTKRAIINQGEDKRAGSGHILRIFGIEICAQVEMMHLPFSQKAVKVCDIRVPLTKVRVEIRAHSDLLLKSRPSNLVYCGALEIVGDFEEPRSRREPAAMQFKEINGNVALSEPLYLVDPPSLLDQSLSEVGYPVRYEVSFQFHHGRSQVDRNVQLTPGKRQTYA